MISQWYQGLHHTYIYRVGQSILDCFLQVRHRCHWGLWGEKFAKLTGGSPSNGISWEWGWSDPLGPQRFLATKSTSELCTGLQHSKIWEDVSKSKKWFLMWKSCEMMASTSHMAKGWKEAMRADLAADLGLFCRWWQVFCQRTCQCWQLPWVFEAPCGPLGPKDVFWWKIHLSADSAPAYTTKTTQWLLAEF